VSWLERELERSGAESSRTATKHLDLVLQEKVRQSTNTTWVADVAEVGSKGRDTLLLIKPKLLSWEDYIVTVRVTIWPFPFPFITQFCLLSL
jgi:hypothetical protein